MHRYRAIRFLLSATYENSRLYRLARTLWVGTRINFGASFLGRITEIKEQEYVTVLNNSKFIKRLLNVYNAGKDRIINYSKRSELRDLGKEFKDNFVAMPVKMGSIILIATILSNIFFSMLLNKEIGLLGWIIRGFFLSVGLSGLFCNSKWKDMKETSLVIKLINTHCKIQN